MSRSIQNDLYSIGGTFTAASNYSTHSIHYYLYGVVQYESIEAREILQMVTLKNGIMALQESSKLLHVEQQLCYQPAGGRVLIYILIIYRL